MELTHSSQTGGLRTLQNSQWCVLRIRRERAADRPHSWQRCLGPDGKPLSIASVELYRAGTYNDAKPGLWGFQGAEGVVRSGSHGAGRIHPGIQPHEPARIRIRRIRGRFIPAWVTRGRCDADQAEGRPAVVESEYDGEGRLSNSFAARPSEMARSASARNVTIMAKADNGENPSAQRGSPTVPINSPCWNRRTTRYPRGRI